MNAWLTREKVKANATESAPVAFLHEPALLRARVHEAPAAEHIHKRFPPFKVLRSVDTVAQFLQSGIRI